MKVLIVGGGAREHAIAAKLKADDASLELIATPGNPGIAEIARCEDVPTSDTSSLVTLADNERFDFTIVGPEAPLEAGIADHFRSRGLPIFGPTASAAQIETSKRFAKELMRGAGVPTARASSHVNAAEAKRALAQYGLPVVVKASGLAAGKGVIIAQSREAAERAIDSMMTGKAFGSAGAEILLEEFMNGEELSVFGITDATNVVTLLPAQDHKRLLDGDAGPNTGGMGAYAPTRLATPDLLSRIHEQIFGPTLRALRAISCEFRGLLYAGLMLTDEGPKVVEFNCRFGDPETEAILPLMSSSLLDLIHAVARGDSLRDCAQPKWSTDTAVTTVVAAAGYPDAVRKGDEIQLPAVPSNVHLFHAGTAMRDGALVSNGGRVLAVTAVDRNVTAAAAASRAYAESVQLEGKQLRRDIGWREMSRLA